MKRNSDQNPHPDGRPDKIQELESGQGAGQSSNFDIGRHLLGADGKKGTCIPQKQLFKDYISYNYEGPDGPPQHAEETLSTSFHHDAPDQESPMSALGPLEMTRDGKLLLQADKHYAQGNHEKAELLLRCVLDNCVQDPERNALKLDQALYGLAKVYKKQKRYGDTEEVYRSIIEHEIQKPQPDIRKIGSAMKGMGDVFKKQDKYNEARVMFKSVLDLCKEQFGDNDLRTAQAMEHLAEVYKKIADTSQDNPEMQEKKRTKAGTLLDKFVLPICKEKLGENDPRTEKVQKKLADLPLKPGQEIADGTRKLLDEKRVNNLLKYMKCSKRFPDLCNPKLFNDKVLHRRLFDRRPIRAQFADKYEVQQYVKDRIGEEYLPKLYHVTADPSTIPFEKLPDKFVIKSTQGWSAMQVEIVTNKSTMNESEIIEKCNKWLKEDNKKVSWLFKHNEHKIVVEEYIDDGNGLCPNDYKFFVYNGKTHFIQVEAGRDTNYSSTFHDTGWNRLEVTHGTGKNCPTPIDKPPHLELMLELARKLGKDQDFLRIDFYDSKQPFLGEITNNPGGGWEPFEPPMYDRIFGEPWTEVHKKCSIPSFPPSPDVCQILRQIACSMHKVVLEGQRNRQYPQEKGQAS